MIAKSKAGEKTLDKGPTVLHGRSVDLLDRLLRSNGFEWSIQDGVLQVAEFGRIVGATAFLLTPTTGLVGSPEFGSHADGHKKKKADAAASAPVLRVGSSGAEVKAVQTKLLALGYDVGPADGIFGPQTQAAVRAFQEDRGLTVDGIVGEETRAALGLPSAAGGKGAGASIVKARSLLQPIYPGRGVEIRSAMVNGVLRVESSHFHGDTHGQDWYVDIEAALPS